MVKRSPPPPRPPPAPMDLRSGSTEQKYDSPWLLFSFVLGWLAIFGWVAFGISQIAPAVRACLWAA